MSYTNIKNIRVEAGFYNQHVNEVFNTPIDGTTNRLYVDYGLNGSLEKFIPTGSTNVLQASDFSVFYGLSGVGATIVSVTAWDSQLGYVDLDTVPVSGASLSITYASSAVSGADVEQVRIEAESAVNNVLSACYAVPLSAQVSEITNLATKLATGYLLVRNYGTESTDTSADGYKLIDYVLGSGENAGNGRLYDFCKENSQLVDDNGNVIPKNESDQVTGSNIYNGLTGGQLFSIEEENFRFKMPPTAE